MEKQTKILYFVTLVIKYTDRKEVKGIKMNSQKVTIYQKIQKESKNDTDAYNQTMVEAQAKYGNLQLIAHTITELTKELFEEEIVLIKKVNGDEDLSEKVLKLNDPGHQPEDAVIGGPESC